MTTKYVDFEAAHAATNAVIAAAVDAAKAAGVRMAIVVSAEVEGQELPPDAPGERKAKTNVGLDYVGGDNLIELVQLLALAHGGLITAEEERHAQYIKRLEDVSIVANGIGRNGSVDLLDRERCPEAP